MPQDMPTHAIQKPPIGFRILAAYEVPEAGDLVYEPKGEITHPATQHHPDRYRLRGEWILVWNGEERRPNRSYAREIEPDNHTIDLIAQQLNAAQERLLEQDLTFVVCFDIDQLPFVGAAPSNGKLSIRYLIGRQVFESIIRQAALPSSGDCATGIPQCIDIDGEMLLVRVGSVLECNQKMEIADINDEISPELRLFYAKHDDCEDEEDRLYSVRCDDDPLYYIFTQFRACDLNHEIGTQEEWPGFYCIAMNNRHDLLMLDLTRGEVVRIRRFLQPSQEEVQTIEPTLEALLAKAIPMKRAAQ
jgi:hypothetical protein